MLHEAGEQDLSGAQFTTPPDYVGGYHIGLVEFCMSQKPIWFHRVMVRLVLGWEWKDSD